MAKLTTLRTWKDAERYQRRHPPRPDGGTWIFRGQSNSCWKLEPSILRLFHQLGLTNPDDPGQVAKAVKAEKEALRAFQNAYAMRIDYRNWLAWWAVAQHYSGATRMLDWSGDSLVALYMAVKDNINKDGTFFALDTDKLDNPDCWFPKDRSDACWAKQHEILECRSGKPPNMHWCKLKGPIFRPNVQDGWFTTCTNVLREQEEVIMGISRDALKKYTIPAKAKQRLLKELCVRACWGPTLFADGPDKDGYRQREQVIMHAQPAPSPKASQNGQGFAAT